VPKGGKVTPIAPSLVARISGAIKGARDGWFGPGEPLQVIAPEQVRGRLWDFPVAWNLNIQPRGEAGESGIDFPTLRALADPTLGGLGLLRLAIETRKDQMESQRWFIRGRDESDGGKTARDIEKWMRFPDGFHTFSQWQRMLLEDLLVIDAPTLYLAPSLLGHLVPQVMDGALLKPLLQEDGRVPLPPENAYQQVLKGVPAVDYTIDEVVRMPRNLRSNRVYGMSPVEQVQMVASIALRRELSQLEYFTAGTTPDVLLGAPEGWTPDQIRTIQEWLDSELSGNTEARRRMRLVPGGITPFPLKGDLLKDEFDEWLAKIICYCFSLSPQALIKQMNRASADTAKQTAQEEGLEPLKMWFKDLIDVLLMKAFDQPELELWYRDEEIGDPAVKATVVSTLAGKKPIITQDEARESFGYDPMTPAQKEELAPAPPPMLGPGANPADKPTNGAVKKPGALQQPAAEKLLKGRKIRFIRDEKGDIVGADLD
jgi:hypothetical protein